MGGERLRAVATLIVVAGALTVLPLAAQRPAAPQQPPSLQSPTPPSPTRIGPRDARQEARGNATIRGRVTIAGTSAPIRGATVRAIPRSAGEVITSQSNEDGWFEFTGLAPGRWLVLAEKGGFLEGSLGQRSAAGPGTPLTIVGNETHSIAVPLSRGAAIAGQIQDDIGEPVVAARVEAMRWTMVEGRRTLSTVGADQTDDTGAYRIHSLPPGDYVVLARDGLGMDLRLARIENVPNASGTGGIVRMVHSVAEAGVSRTIAPTYFPGTTSVGDAQRVTLRRGEERLGVSFGLTTTTLARISGTVVSSSGAPIEGQVTVSLLDASGGSIPGPVTPGSRRTDGTFELRDVAPGSYTLVAAHGSFPAPQSEYAMLPIVVSGEDITGLTVVTRPGGSVKGTVTGDGEVMPNTSDMGVYARPLNRGSFPLVDIGAPVRDGRFEIANIAATSRLMIDRMPQGWMLKSITIGGVDVTDRPIEFTSGQQITADVVLTNRLTRLAGVVTEAGKPVEDATVVVFPADPSKWAFPSRFVAKGRSDQSGNYTVAGLAPFDSYLAVAVKAYESTQEQDPAFLEDLRSLATPFSLGAGESKRLNLAIIE